MSFKSSHKKPTPGKQTDPEAVASELPSSLRMTLATFAGSPSGVAEIAVASMGLGSRLMLEQAGLIEDAGTLREPLDPKITRFGRKVFSACAMLVDRERRARLDEHIAGAQHREPQGGASPGD